MKHKIGNNIIYIINLKYIYILFSTIYSITINYIHSKDELRKYWRRYSNYCHWTTIIITIDIPTGDNNDLILIGRNIWCGNNNLDTSINISFSLSVNNIINILDTINLLNLIPLQNSLFKTKALPTPLEKMKAIKCMDGYIVVKT